MRRLGHHVYTSFAGQRTVYLSPWLAGAQGLFEARASGIYAEPGALDVLHQDGLWLVTTCHPNGTDHVGRPRQLVHQMAIADVDLPVLMPAPLLTRLTLTRLEHDDPALDRRLPQDLDQVDLGALMPRPDTLPGLLRGPTRSVLAAFLAAVRQPGRTITVRPQPLAEALRDLPAALLAVLVHRPPCRISTRSEPLPGPRPASLPTLLIADGKGSAGRDLGETLMAVDEFADTAWWPDTVAGAGLAAPRMLLLLREIPLVALLDYQGSSALRRALRTPGIDFDREGTPLLPADSPAARELAQALIAAGAATAVARLIAVRPDLADLNPITATHRRSPL